MDFGGITDERIALNEDSLWSGSVQNADRTNATNALPDYHLNINLQMIYWPSEVCNLTDLNEPLFGYIESLREPGERTAKNYYAARGWVAHVLANASASLRPAKVRRGVRRPATPPGSARICGNTGGSRTTKNISHRLIR